MSKSDPEKSPDPTVPALKKRPRLGWLGGVIAEKYYAWRASKELLTIYHRIRREHPHLTGDALHTEIVIRGCGVNAATAITILRRAEESFCGWPGDGRDLRFLDVARYVVVHDYLRSHPTVLGTRTNMGAVIARVIDRHL